MKLKVLVWQEQDQWCASVPALPGCHTWGNSYDHLMEMVKEAVEGWLEVASEQEEAIAYGSIGVYHYDHR